MGRTVIKTMAADVNKKKLTTNVSEKVKGRPLTSLVPVTLKKLVELGKMGCSIQEVADYFGIHRDTVLNKFAKEYRASLSDFKIAIRKRQFEVAKINSKEGADMLKHLGKHYLNQIDKPEPSVQIFTAPVDLSTSEIINEIVGEVIDPLLLPDETK